MFSENREFPILRGIDVVSNFCGQNMVQNAGLFLVKIKCLKNNIQESSLTVFYKSFTGGTISIPGHGSSVFVS